MSSQGNESRIGGIEVVVGSPWRRGDAKRKRESGVAAVEKSDLTAWRTALLVIAVPSEVGLLSTGTCCMTRKALYFNCSVVTPYKAPNYSFP